MDNKLTQQEIDYLTRFLHINTKPLFSYLAMGMLALLAFLGGALGFFYKSNYGFLIAGFLLIIYFKTMNDKKILTKQKSQDTRQ